MTRAALSVAGILTLIVVWLAPLGAWLPGPFSAHMTVHMGVVALAAPLLSLAVAGTRLDPVWRAPALFSPVPASVVELVIVWAWHAPALHHWARASTAALVLEQSSFLLSGVLVWLSSFGGGPVDRGSRRAAGVVALLLTSMHMTLLGALLALPPRPLYAHVHPAAGVKTHVALDDQHLGGAIMLLAGGVAYIAGGLALMAGLVRGRTARVMARTAP